VADAQKLGDFVLGLLRFRLGNRRHVDGLEILRAGEAVEGRRIRNADKVVPAAEAPRFPLGLENSENQKGHPGNANGLADGVLILLEEVFLDVGPDDADLGRSADHALVEESAVLDIPLADEGIALSGSLDHRVPIVVSINELGPGRDAGGDGLDRGQLPDGLGVLGCQAVELAGLGPGAAHHPPVAGDEHQVRPHGRELRFNGRPGPGSDADHGDDRGHADDDAQASEKRPHLVPGQGPERNAQYPKDVHSRAPWSVFPDDKAVLHMEAALGPGADVRLVGHHDDADAVFMVEPLEDVHDLVARF